MVTAGRLPLGTARHGDQPNDPELLDRPRRFERRHLLVVAMVMVFGVIGTWVWLGRSTETVLPVAAAPRASVEASPGAMQPSPTVRPGILVHVIGAVERPGVVELPAGARVQAAIAAAGGLRADADPALLNLAAVVADGAQLVIGTKQQPAGEIRAASGSGSDSSAKVNLNTASQAELETLPGVGPATAQAILAWRSSHGKFSSASELQEVDGIGAKTYAKLAPLVDV